MILGLFSCLGFYPLHNFIFFWTILTNHEWSWLPFILCWSCSIYFIQPSPSNKAKNIPQVHMRFKHIIWNFKRSHVWGKKFWSHGRKFSILQHLPLRYSSSKNSARSTNLSYVFVFSNINIFLLVRRELSAIIIILQAVLFLIFKPKGNILLVHTSILFAWHYFTYNSLNE